MNNSFGKNLIYTSFGESHGKGIGFVLDGLPAGIKIDFDYIEKELSKRRPKKDLGTSRVETDNYEIVSGIFNGYTTGTPITGMLEDVQSITGYLIISYMVNENGTVSFEKITSSK